LSGAGADLAARLNPGPRPAQLEEHRARRLCQVSELHHRRNLGSLKKATSDPRQEPDRPEDVRTLKSKGVVKHPRSSAAEHRRPLPAQVLESVPAGQSEDSLVTASRPRRVRALLQVNRELEKNADNQELVDLPARHLSEQAEAKLEVEEKEVRARWVNLAANQELERLLHPSAGRKRPREHLCHDHNCSTSFRSGSGATKFRSRSVSRQSKFKWQ
jgi:hypothetical protein